MCGIQLRIIPVHPWLNLNNIYFLFKTRKSVSHVQAKLYYTFKIYHLCIEYIVTSSVTLFTAGSSQEIYTQLISQYNLVLQATWVVDIFIIFMQWFWHSAVIRIKHCCSRWREKRSRVGLTGTRPPPRCHCPSSPRSPFLKNVPSRSTEYAVS